MIEELINYYGHDLESKDRIESMEECIEKAAKVEKAKFWTYEPRTKKCWIKTSKRGRRKHRNAGVSGNVKCEQIKEGEWFINSIYQRLLKIQLNCNQCLKCHKFLGI